MAVRERKRLGDIFDPLTASAKMNKWLSTAHFHAILLLCCFEVSLHCEHYIQLVVVKRLHR